MLYVLILLLTTILIALLCLQKMRERDWLHERLLMLQGRLADGSYPTEDGLPFQLVEQEEQPRADEPSDVQEPQPTASAAEQEIEEDTAVPVHEAESQPIAAAPTVDIFCNETAETISADEVLRNLSNSRLAKQVQPHVIVVEADETGIHVHDSNQPEPELEIITLEEATRFQHHPLMDEDDWFQAAEANSDGAQNIIIPTDDSIYADTSIHTETEDIGSTVKNDSSEASAAETIDFQSIQNNLLRQRIARHHAHAQARQADAPSVQPETALHEIAAAEVWANLNHTHIPAAKRIRAAMAQSNRQAAAPQHFTPFANRTASDAVLSAHNNDFSQQAAVQIADTPVFPGSAMQPPSVHEEPVSFMPASDEPQSADHSWLAEINDAPQQPETEIADYTFTEQDFSEYYAGQDIGSEWPLVGTNDSERADEEGESWLDTFNAAFAEQPESPDYTLPPLTLLLPPEHNPKAVQSAEDLLENSITIEEKLAEYRVKVKVLDAYAGPVITRYEVEPDTGVRGSSVMNLEKDLARSLGVAAIRVVETIPGKTCMGLELPNPKRQMIRLREVFNSEAFSGSQSKLTLALGQDITGAPVVTDLAKAPHLLVAGTTGSGKSVGVNSMILSMLYKASPEDVRMIMIDPKMLELSIYEGIPHLLAPVVTDMKLAANALTWCVNEMEKRYRLMSHLGVRNLAGYNQKINEAQKQGRKIANPFSFTPDDAEPLEKLPFIVVVVDEFADLMMVAGKQIEQLIARLAQKARAAGIHLILATQRPSVDVITGLIKANIPTRIAFQVSTKIDSRTILDQMGAENLLGQGDMLFLPPGTGYPQRVHGAFVADNEVHAVVEYLKQFGEPDYVDDILNPMQEEFGFDGISGSSERDPLFDKAVEIVTRSRKTSISYLQRQLRTGYNKAATLMEQLEAEGIVSAPDHSGKRTIMTRNHSEN